MKPRRKKPFEGSKQRPVRRNRSKPFGKQGRKLASEVIKQHTVEIEKLEKQQKTTTNQLRKKLLAEQIAIEKKELEDFKKQTQ